MNEAVACGGCGGQKFMLVSPDRVYCPKCQKMLAPVKWNWNLDDRVKEVLRAN